MLRVAAVALVLLAGCSFQPRTLPPSQPPATADGNAAPRPEPRSRYGNPASYEQFGRTYRVLDSARGFNERGIASWYGRDFHGKRTSSGEPYDMYAMTAAHKTLPLPTWVEVRNLKNNKRITVRVNDRGPFVANRIIDLSYEAARRLDLVRDGTGLVEVRALEFDGAGNIRTAPQPAQPVATVVRHADAEPASPPAIVEPVPLVEPAPATDTPQPASVRLFAQVGAFASLDNAEGMFIRLRETGFTPVDIVTLPDESPPLYRVRIGPVADADALDAMVTALGEHGISGIRVIIE